MRLFKEMSAKELNRINYGHGISKRMRIKHALKVSPTFKGVKHLLNKR